MSDIIQIRKATPADAEGVAIVANNRAREAMRQRGASDNDLKRLGFVLFPKSVEKYKNRILVSDHFWVAARGKQIVGYRMAYSLDQMRSIPDADENDKTCEEYYTKVWGALGSSIYLHQSARLLSDNEYESFAQSDKPRLLTIPDSEKRFMRELAEKFIAHARRTEAPMIVCDIAQSPMRNVISSEFALKCGFAMVAQRPKWDESIKCDRTSGTFLLTLGQPS